MDGFRPAKARALLENVRHYHTIPTGHAAAEIVRQLRFWLLYVRGQSFCVICAQLPILLEEDTKPGCCGGNPKMQDIADVTPSEILAVFTFPSAVCCACDNKMFHLVAICTGIGHKMRAEMPKLGT